MPITAEFRRALDIEREMTRIVNLIGSADDAVEIAGLNRILDLLTRELAELQATMAPLASAA